MALRYVTVQGFWKFLGINRSIMDFNVDETPSRETVASATVTAGDYYLDHQGVNEDTLKLYAATAGTQLDIDTHYTFDSDTSKITITEAGAIVLSGEDLEAEYEYCELGGYNHLTYNECDSILDQAERRVSSETSARFADQSSDTPGYLQISDELLPGLGHGNTLYQLRNAPVVKLQTTTNGEFTTGGTEITLTDASGFPSSGTIYIDGNKVEYTARASNVLTVPSSTPTISDGSTVRGEVVEVSTSPSGVDPSFTVITPDSDYAIDYTTGEVQLQEEYYFAEDTYLLKPQDGIFDRVRVTYCHAWHEDGQDATIPDEIKQVVYMIAARQLAQRTVLSSLVGQRDGFNPESFGFSKVDIDEILARYRVLKISNV